MLIEPVPKQTLRVLRSAVFDLATSEHRSTNFATVLHVGVPGERDTAWSVDDENELDHTLRTDIVAALAHKAISVGPAALLVWLARPGAPAALGAHDLAWGAATYAALGELDIDATYVVVGRHGWCDPFTGTQRRWARARQRSS